MLTRARGRVIRVDAARGETLEIVVEVAGAAHDAIAYTSLTGSVEVGDEVLLNTTAVAKSLGTGGAHFVMANLSREDAGGDDRGHIVKARYTPVQHTVLSVEEEESPHRAAIESFESLNSMPVVIGQLHSQLAPAAAAIKRRTRGRARVAYVMTDSAALPLGFSRLVNELTEKGLLDSTVTAGQAFGGEYEAVNVYTALIAAREAARADAAVVCPGPGNAGTGTTFGFSSIEQGEIVNAVNALGGCPIAAARISFADPRPRHQGISHHTMTALGRIAITRCAIALPVMDPLRLLAVQEQIAHSPISFRHRVRILDGRPGILELQDRGIRMSSMGRQFDDDPEFFLAASAAGALAAEMLVNPD